jgi:hypothetical protein
MTDHRTGAISTYLGYGFFRKHNIPMVKMVVGQGRPNVGMAG